MLAIFYAETADVFRISNALSQGDMQRAKFKCDEKMNNGECFCVNSDILKHSVAMSDPCENLELTPGLKLMVWESRVRMKLPNFYVYCHFGIFA